MPRPFLARAAAAGAALLVLVAIGASGLLETLAWAVLALAVGSEVLASAVFLSRRRRSRS
jgi:hypothetical protein